MEKLIKVLMVAVIIFVIAVLGSFLSKLIVTLFPVGGFILLFILILFCAYVVVDTME